jgi:hypothetical protein
VTAAEILERRADEFKAIGQEQTSEGDGSRQVYLVVELVLREVALALDKEREAA